MLENYISTETILILIIITIIFLCMFVIKLVKNNILVGCHCKTVCARNVNLFLLYWKRCSVRRSQAHCMNKNKSNFDSAQPDLNKILSKCI